MTRTRLRDANGRFTPPPAPSFGAHESVDRYGRHLGAVVEVHTDTWTPVCVHKDCMRRLVARNKKDEAKEALRLHWTLDHSRSAA
jgi:hypothetical protein